MLTDKWWQTSFDFLWPQNSELHCRDRCRLNSLPRPIRITIDTEMKAKRDNIISELTTLRITKAKAKENSGGGVDETMKFTLNWLSCQKIIGITIGAKIITHTTFIVGELILQLHTHQLHSFNCGGINLCNACVSLVSACLASMISQKGKYTTIMLGELISNYTHTSYTSVIVGELIV